MGKLSWNRWLRFTIIGLRATSYTRLRAHNHYTSSTCNVGNGRAGLSSLHTTLEEPTEYVNTRWMQSLHGFVHGVECIMFHGLFPKTTSRR